MAIYNNREVVVQGPTHMQSLPETLRITHQDNTQENVAIASVKLTEDEKKNLVKKYPSRFENSATATDEDIKAVRLGLAPPSDPTVKEQARLKAHAKKRDEEYQKQFEAVRKEAESNVDKKDAPTQDTSHTPHTYQVR